MFPIMARGMRKKEINGLVAPPEKKKKFVRHKISKPK
jgi:hypothetical protein